MQPELQTALKLKSRFGWLQGPTLIGAVVCSFWLLYRVFEANGILLTIFVFVGLSMLYKFGVSPMFAVAASFLSFKYKAVGAWLPILSYVVAAVTLYVDLRMDRLRQALGM